MAQQLTHQRTSRRAALLLLALVVVLVSGAFETGPLGLGTAKASILLPQIGLQVGLQGDNSLTAEQLAEQLIVELEAKEAGSSGSSGATSSSTPRSSEPASADEDRPLQKENFVRQLAAMTSQTEGSTSGTSSPSSGSSSAGNGASLLSGTAMVMSDESPVERYAAELALSIPDAPGTELLRPPQPVIV